MTDDTSPENESDQDLKSKSQLKREMHALVELGDRLTELPLSQLAELELDEFVDQLIGKIRAMPKREARRRELRFLAKQLRELDLSHVEAFLESLSQGRRDKAREFQELENLRDEALADHSAGVASIMERYPSADRQHLAQLLRNAAKEQANNKPPASARKLFKYLRDLSEA